MEPLPQGAALARMAWGGGGGSRNRKSRKNRKIDIFHWIFAFARYKITSMEL
jgi:hypothetical protein